MGSRVDLHCWEIMHCKNPDACPAKKHPHRECWEIASETGNFRHALNICRDCIVRMIKEGSTSLSSQEVMCIMETRTKTHQVEEALSSSSRPLNVIEQFFG